MLELDVTKKIHSDNLKGYVTVGDVELYPNIDAMSVYDALNYMDEATTISQEYSKNPENPMLKKKVAKAGILVFKAIRTLYDDEQIEKIKKLNLRTEDLGILIKAATQLFDMREEANSSTKN